MKTLTATKINRGTHSSTVTICEVDDDGARDGFEEIEVPHDSTVATDADKVEIDSALRSLATERGLDY